MLLSSVAGGLEPCGCVKDMLGGVDHAAAYVRAQRATPTLVLGAGPMLFLDPTVHADRAAQDRWKAEALAQSLREMGLRAWAPGANDFAAGAEDLARLTAGGPALIAANLRGNGPVPLLAKTSIFSAGGIKVGVAGVSMPKHAGKLPDGLEALEPEAELQNAAAELARQGAELRVALVALPRGEALRLAERVPDFQVMLIGKAVDQGDANDPVTPPTQIGRTLVVESPNHLQAVYAVDLFVKNGRFEFENAAAGDEQRAELDRRIGELEQRIAAAERDSRVGRADLAARRRDLDALRARRKSEGQAAKAPAGSHYRASLVEVRESLGADPAVTARLSEYYRRVNDHNRQAFKDRRPPAVPAGQSGYLGVERCAACHASEHAFWKKTAHAGAYATLSRQHKEFNLDCVSCHVTGYERPGGSTVTAVAGLVDVQCEVCHGPGSRHAASPGDKSLIVKSPPRGQCASECHHPPHVKPTWSADEAWKQIVGPGHGG